MEALGTFVTWVFGKWQDYRNLDDNRESLEKELQRLRVRKSDIEFDAMITERSGAKKRKREVDSWFEEVEETKNDFNVLTESVQQGGFLEKAFRSGERVKKIRTRVEELLAQSQQFGETCLKDFGNRGAPRVTEKLIGEKFDEDLKRILAWLEIDNISNIGIYRMGGVGKTTLAKHIHNHLLENPDLNIYWVTVSQEFSIKKLQDDIAKCLGLDQWNEDDEDRRASILSRALPGRSVLIMDDVWEEICLKKIGISLGANKSRLIFTTRSLQVCRGMNCQRELEVKTLGPNESWNLFKTTLHLKTKLPADVEKVAKSVTERCAGLPLGIITVAGSMRGVRDICEWRNALEQLKASSVGHDEMEKNVFPILGWSFNRLNECQRHCFLYCSLYPEDSKLKREELIDLFIWAELMPKRNSRSEEFDQGHAILNKLIKVCLLEETKNFEGDDCVKMHDLVRDMALRITSGSSKLKMSGYVPQFLVKSLGKGHPRVTVLEPKEWTEDLHAVSFHSLRTFHSLRKEIEVPPAWSPNCPKLSTLLLPGFGIERIPDSFFWHMCGLKVLNLNGCPGITELPNSVSDLVNLTALILRHCKHLQSVPPVGKLKQLRELDLSLTKIQDLPQGWESLVNLERLNLKQCVSFIPKIIPRGTFTKLHRLQRLVLAPPIMVQVNDPEVLNQLETFIGCLCFDDFYRISRWPKKYSLYINNDYLPSHCGIVMGKGDRSQKELFFDQCNFGGRSNCPLLLLPSDMKELKLERCVGGGIRCLSDVFKNFTSLNDLSSLDICDLDGMEYLWRFASPAPRDKLVDSSFSPLRNLKGLSLENLPDLVGLFFGESAAYLLPPGTFSSLMYLWIVRCHNMKQLFTVQLLQSLQNLESLEIKDCKGLEEIAADDNGLGQGGGEGIQLTSSETTAILIFPKLRWLNLLRLPQLKNICKVAMICDSIGMIQILDCPKVKRLPLFLPTINELPSPPNTLHTIRGDKEWWESLEWENPCAKNALDPFFITVLKQKS